MTPTDPPKKAMGMNTADSTMATGVSEDYLTIKHYDISKGRDLQYSDIAMRSKVCVVGAYVDQAYFGGSAVGQTLRVRGQTLTVIGVIQQQSDTLEEGGTDDCLYLPYSVAQRIAGSVNAYTITMQDEDHMDESVNALETALYQVFASDDYYTVTSMAEMLDTMTGMINILVYVLAGIAAISLVVGGIGIMNIMLVSVTERTREIGIRKSLGAKRKDIRRQFVIEAGTTSAIGGLLGIALGYLLATGVGALLGGMLAAQMGGGATFSAAPTFGSVAISFGVSVGIGVLFGYLPANKAAKLNPIDALRYD